MSDKRNSQGRGDLQVVKLFIFRLFTCYICFLKNITHFHSTLFRGKKFLQIHSSFLQWTMSSLFIFVLGKSLILYSKVEDITKCVLPGKVRSHSCFQRHHFQALHTPEPTKVSHQTFSPKLLSQQTEKRILTILLVFSRAILPCRSSGHELQINCLQTQ